MKSALILGAGLLALTTVTAQAAEPDNGTLTLESGNLEYSEGPNFGANPTIDVESLLEVEHSCVPGALPCDSYALSIDLPEGIESVFPESTITILVDADDPSGAGVEDYDIYLFDSEGEQVANSVNGGVPEQITILAESGIHEYRIEVGYYITLGSTYTATVSLNLGEPAEGADVEAFFNANSAARALIRGEEATESSAYAQRRSAGGALGAWLFGLCALAGLRRRAAKTNAL